MCYPGALRDPIRPISLSSSQNLGSIGNRFGNDIGLGPIPKICNYYNDLFDKWKQEDEFKHDQYLKEKDKADYQAILASSPAAINYERIADSHRAKFNDEVGIKAPLFETREKFEYQFPKVEPLHKLDITPKLDTDKIVDDYLGRKFESNFKLGSQIANKFDNGAVFKGVGKAKNGLESHFTYVEGEGFHLTERGSLGLGMGKFHEERFDIDDFQF